jgi:hypothetical protein
MILTVFRAVYRTLNLNRLIEQGRIEKTAKKSDFFLTDIRCRYNPLIIGV